MNTLYMNHYVNPDLILKESEEFYRFIRIIRLKSYVIIEKMLRIFTTFPQVLDQVVYLFVRFN